MKLEKILVMVLASLVLAACEQPRVVVTAALEAPDPEGDGTVVRPLSDLEVELLPYDRDAVFDSLQAAFADPEPPIPDSLIEAREAVAAAQEDWRQYETRWNVLRDTLQTINTAMEEYNPAEARYRELFNEFQDLESELTTVEDSMDAAFERFDSLQQGIIAQSEAIQADRTGWADRAFADAMDVVNARIQEAGRDPVVDTTDATGSVTFQAPAGEWWVYTRTELPYSELYWNVPITLEGEEPLQLRLSDENAEERPNL